MTIRARVLATFLVLGAVAFLAVAADAKPRPAAPPPAPAAPAVMPARALVDSLAALYGGMSAFHFSGVTHTRMTGGQLPNPVSLDVGFVYAGRFPSRLRTEMTAPGMSSMFVADGESLCVVAPDLKQFLVQPAPALQPGTMPEHEFATALMPLYSLGQITERLASAEDFGADTVVTAEGTVNARRLLLTYAPDTSARAPKVLPRVLWIDEAAQRIVRDSITLEYTTPGAGLVQRSQDMRFVAGSATDAGPDSLYRIAVPAGLSRVERFGAPAPPSPGDALVGKPAKDFTLSTLAGTRVTLSKLRGKVVVLDFWATWCGPCRRWMPIVAKLEGELKGRDVRFYAVNLRDPAAKVRSFLQETKTTVPVLLDPDGKIGELYGAASIPLTVVIGRDGKVSGTLLGLHPEDDLRAALRKAGVSGI